MYATGLPGAVAVLGQAGRPTRRRSRIKETAVHPLRARRGLCCAVESACLSFLRALLS